MANTLVITMQGKTVVKLMSVKILHTDFRSAHMHSARVSNLEPMV